MKIICLDTVESTNTWVAQNEKDLPSPSMVRCITQSAGRGQRGNSWESEPGKNFTGTVLLHPEDFPASSQFQLSEAIALAIVETLAEYGIEAKIKWPNDIYVGDKKICGILVENVITGTKISRSIAGFGLNVNQEKFVSNAPNPVSMKQLTSKDYNVEEVSERLALNIEKKLKEIKETETLHAEFKRNLWRKDENFYPFHDRKSDERIAARIHEVGIDGILTLMTSEGEARNYAFKEVEFILG